MSNLLTYLSITDLSIKLGMRPHFAVDRGTEMKQHIHHGICPKSMVSPNIDEED